CNETNVSLPTIERLRNSAKDFAKRVSKLSRRSARKSQSCKVMRQPGVRQEEDFAQYFFSPVILTRSDSQRSRHVLPPPRKRTQRRSGFCSRGGVDQPFMPFRSIKIVELFSGGPGPHQFRNVGRLRSHL